MDELSDDRLREITLGPWRRKASQDDVDSMATEIVRHRAMVKRLEAWATALDGDGPEDGGSYANLLFADGLRNRMKGG